MGAWAHGERACPARALLHVGQGPTEGGYLK